MIVFLGFLFICDSNETWLVLNLTWNWHRKQKSQKAFISNFCNTLKDKNNSEIYFRSPCFVLIFSI